MPELFEYSDKLNSPVEAFYCSPDTLKLPVKAHWHYFIEFLYMKSGSVSISCNETEYMLNEGELLLIPPRTIHTIYKKDSAPYYYSCVKFSINRIQPIEDYLPNLGLLLQNIMLIKKPPLVFTKGDFEEMSPEIILDNIISEVSRKNYGYNTIVYSMLSALILKLMRKWYESGINMNTETATDGDRYSVQDAILYIDRHSQENISIAGLAEMCNMSYSYFAKVFHRQYGQSCKQYIEFIRLSKAENLLLFTDRDLTDIANETGFADCSHLIRCFKKRYGTTPKQYRLQHGLLEDR